LDAAVAQTHAGLRGTFGLMLVMSALGLLGLALVIGRLRRSSADLEQHARALQGEITERQRAEEALQYRVSFEKLITTISTHFMNLAAQEIDSGIHHALHTIGAFAGVDRSYVWLFSSNGTTMDNTHEWCAAGVVSYIHQRQGLSVAAWPWFAEKIRRLETIHIPCVSELPSAAHAEKAACQSQGLQSLITVPMVYGGSLIGCLGCEVVRAEKTWSEDSIALLKIVGEILVNALERKRTEEAIRQALAASEASRDELERFNRFAIGRELRMIELKEQVNALLTARGEPAMYTIDATEEEHR
jgi:transcriptional regulator with GAF, ATPase, and Fis domain